MFRTPQSGGSSFPLRGREWACLLLAITFLYNPFLAASPAPLGRSVSHLPSFRATLASAEFLKFKPREKFEAPSAPECDVVGLLALAVMTRMSVPISHLASVEDVGPLYPFFEGSLWFRPPPGARGLYLQTAN